MPAPDAVVTDILEDARTSASCFHIHTQTHGDFSPHWAQQVHIACTRAAIASTALSTPGADIAAATAISEKEPHHAS